MGDTAKLARERKLLSGRVWRLHQVLVSKRPSEVIFVGLETDGL